MRAPVVWPGWRSAGLRQWCSRTGIMGTICETFCHSRYGNSITGTQYNSNDDTQDVMNVGDDYGAWPGRSPSPPSSSPQERTRPSQMQGAEVLVFWNPKAQRGQLGILRTLTLGRPPRDHQHYNHQPHMHNEVLSSSISGYSLGAQLDALSSGRDNEPPLHSWVPFADSVGSAGAGAAVESW